MGILRDHKADGSHNYMSQKIPSGQSVSFSDLGLSPKLLTILNQLKFTTPTPIQLKAIPVAGAGKDVIGVAQTGTGKTLAFALPMLQQITKLKKQGLIIVPTRELAMQVEEQFTAVDRSLRLKHTVLIGGESMGRQIEQIRRNPDVIIATPGRLLDHLQAKRLHLKNVGVLVLDEADRMLDMGFAPQIQEILKFVPRERQTMLFSATMPPEIVKIANNHMKLPVRIEVARAGTVAEQVNQEMFIVRKEDKMRLLEKMLGEYKGTVLVFSRTKHGAKKICRALNHMGQDVAEIHSNLSLAQRKRSLEGFKSGKYRILVATDIAARGIDVSDIELVVNFDLPDSPDDYVHRVGRTGRAGKMGQAVSFIMPDQQGKVRLIERLVRQQLLVSPLPELPAHRAAPPHEQGGQQGGYQRRGQQGGRSFSRSNGGQGGRGRGFSKQGGNGGRGFSRSNRGQSDARGSQQGNGGRGFSRSNGGQGGRGRGFSNQGGQQGARSFSRSNGGQGGRSRAPQQGNGGRARIHS